MGNGRTWADTVLTDKVDENAAQIAFVWSDVPDSKTLWKIIQDQQEVVQKLKNQLKNSNKGAKAQEPPRLTRFWLNYRLP